MFYMFYMQLALVCVFGVICVCVLIDTIYSFIKNPTSNTHIAEDDFDDIHCKLFCESFSPIIVDRLKTLDEFDNHYND